MKWMAFVAVWLGIQQMKAQTYYPDANLRLQLVWSRVADINGELGSIESAEFSPDGRFIVSGSKFDNSVIMWRTSDGAELWRQYTAEEIERVAWSADGQMVASASEDFLVQIWDASEGTLLMNLPHDQGIDGLCWSNQKPLLLTGEEETKVAGSPTKGWVRAFEFPSGKEVHRVDVGGTTNEIMFSDDGTYFLAAGHGFVKVFATEGFEEQQHLAADEFVKFTTAAFSPDGTMVAASGFGGNIFVWHWSTGQSLKKYNYRGRKVESIAWHPSGDYLVTSGHGAYLNIFRTRDILSDEDDEVQAAAQVFANDGGEYIDFTADGSFLVSAHQDGIIRLWVWKGEDPYLNTKRHRWVSKKQKEAAKSRN